MILRNRYVLMSICLIFLLFGAMSIVSAEDVSDNGTVLDSNSGSNVIPSGVDSSVDVGLNKITSQKKNTKIIAKNSSFIPKSGKYFTTTLKDTDGKNLANKTLKISVNSKTYTRTTNSKGQVSLKVTAKALGKYKTTIKFLGDSDYNKSSSVVTVTIKKFSTKIIASNSVYPPNSGKFYVVTLKDSENNIIPNTTVKMYINNKVFTLTVNSTGNAKVKLLMSIPKKYKVVTKFLGSSQYLATSKVSYVTVEKVATNITAKNMYCDVNTQKNFIITLKDKNNKVLTNKKVKFKLNGVIYSRTTNSNGQASIPVKLSSAKTYKLLSYYAGSSYYDKILKSNKVYVLNNRTPVVISVLNTKIGLNYSTNINISLKDKNKNILSNKSLSVSLNNKAYTLKTNNKGIVSLKFKSTSLKSYPITVSFEGNSVYKDASIKSTIKTVKTTLTIQNSKLITEGYLRILLNNNINDIANKKVIISVNGVNYTKFTNNEGSVIIKNNLSAGVYSVSVTYNDDCYGLITQTKKISCIKGSVINPLSAAVPLVKGVPDVDYMPSSYVWAVDNSTYTLLCSQYKEVIKRDSYCLYLNNALSKYTFFKTKLEPKIYHVIKREKWNIIEQKINTAIVKANKKDYWPDEITASLKGSGYSYSEVRDEQNTGYTCGPTSASTCTQVLRNYYNEAYLSVLAGTTSADGSSTSGLKKALESCNMSCKYFYKTSWQTALNELAKGGRALVFHTWSHYISIIDISPDKTKVLVSNPSGTYDKGSHGIPTNWVSVEYLYESGFNDYDTSSLIVKLDYSLSSSTKNQINNFYNSMGGKWSRTNLNERPAKITNIWG